MAKKSKLAGNWGPVLNETLGIAVGALATGFVAKGIKKAMPKASDKMIAIAPVLVGAFMLKTQSGFIRSVGYGLVGSGITTALKAFGIGGVPIAQGGDSDIDEVLSMLDMQQDAMDEGMEYAVEGESPIAGTQYDEVGLAA